LVPRQSKSRSEREPTYETSDPSPDCGRDAHYWAPPAQNRTCSFPAYGSHLGCLTAGLGLPYALQPGDTLSRHCVRHVRHRFAFSLASALRSTASAAGRPALFGGFVAVESGEVGLIAQPPPARSNGSCSFPASRFPMWVALVGEGWVVSQGRDGSAARGRSLR